MLFTRAIRVSATGGTSLRLALHGGTTHHFGGNLECVLRATGACASSFPDLNVLGTLVGVQFSDPNASVDLHVGPALAAGTVGHEPLRHSFTRVGVEGRANGTLVLAPGVGLTFGISLLTASNVDGYTVGMRTISAGLRFF